MDLIQKYRDALVNRREYVLCRQVLKKINESILSEKSDSVELNLDKISGLTEEEVSVFSLPVSKRIILSIRQIYNVDGIRPQTILKTIYKLRDDILDNKIKNFQKQQESLDLLFKIVDGDLYKDNYNLILDWIKNSFDNKLLDLDTTVDLNFYILRKCNDYGFTKEEEESLEVIELKENIGIVTDIRKDLEKIFAKYGYVYDRKELEHCGGEINFVKYAKIDYVDYVLSKFKRYGITQNELYVKKAFYNIVIDNDKKAFNSILDFIDKNECTLGTLLYIPSIFAKRKKEYVMNNNSRTSRDVIGASIKISGSNNDFFKNMELYKKLVGVTSITDVDLERMGKYVATPYQIVEKNINLLVKYKILEVNKFPNTIVSLCGKRTEYLIDRFIEASLYDSYLIPRVTKKGEVKAARGTSLLFNISSPFIFYKIKRAYDVGESVFHSNAGIRKVIRDDYLDYMGLKLREEGIIQEPMSMSMIDGIDYSIKKVLPNNFYQDRELSWDSVALMEFNNLYKYRTFSPVDIYMKNTLKGELISKIFEKDYQEVVSHEDVLEDEFIKLLDNAYYCDSSGNAKPLKTSDLQYEFSHPYFTNINIVISRYKVLRLCKLLKENDCWINQDSSLIDKENALLSVVIKDSIVSDYEMVMLRFVIRTILFNKFIKVSSVEEVCKERRGAR